jgi:hypothetical protein
MPTIAACRTALLTDYQPAPNAAVKIASAHALVALALNDTTMMAAHRKHLLKLAQWWVTEADTKWKTRFRSAEVIRLAKEDAESNIRINHEHVYGRAQVADQMLASPSQVVPILALCVGCIVTVDEHVRLTRQTSFHGWDRYREAGVVVRDMEVQGWPTYPWPPAAGLMGN